MAFTPSSLLAAEGIMKGLAFDRSYLDTVLAPYASLACILAAQTAITSVPSPGILGASTFPAFTGVVDSSQSNLIAAILYRADHILPPGDSGTLYQFMLTSNTYIADITNYLDAIDTLSNKSVTDMAIDGSTFTDSIDMGLSTLVDDPSRLPDLGAAIGKIGSLYDFSNVNTLGTARNVAAMIMDRYYPSRMKAMFAVNGVDVTDIYAEENEAPALRALAKLTGDHITQIQITFDATFPSTVKTMADVIDLDKMMAEVSDTITFKSLPDLFSAFQFFPQTATLGSAQSIQTLLESITVPDLPSLADPDLSFSDVLDYVGSNAANDGPPTLLDMMGSIVATTFEDHFPTLVTALTAIQATPLGLATIQLCQDISNDPGAVTVPATVATIEANLTTMAATPDGILATTAHDAILAQLTLEEQNTSLARLNHTPLDAEPASPAARLRFAQGLTTLATDPVAAQILTTLATNTIYGDAIKATIIEGTNTTALQDAGLNPPNTA